MASGKISPAQLKPTLPPIFYMTDDGARDASAALMSFGDRDNTAAAGDFTHTYLALLPRDVCAHVERLVRARWLDTGVLQGVNIALGANARITECVVMRNGDYVCILTDFVSDSKIETVLVRIERPSSDPLRVITIPGRLQCLHDLSPADPVLLMTGDPHPRLVALNGQVVYQWDTPTMTDSQWNLNADVYPTPRDAPCGWILHNHRLCHASSPEVWYPVAQDNLPPKPSYAKFRWLAFTDCGVLLMLIWSDSCLLLREVLSGRVVYRINLSMETGWTIACCPRLGVIGCSSPVAHEIYSITTGILLARTKYNAPTLAVTYFTSRFVYLLQSGISYFDPKQPTSGFSAMQLAGEHLALHPQVVMRRHGNEALVWHIDSRSGVRCHWPYPGKVDYIWYCNRGVFVVPQGEETADGTLMHRMVLIALPPLPADDEVIIIPDQMPDADRLPLVPARVVYGPAANLPVRRAHIPTASSVHAPLFRVEHELPGSPATTAMRGMQDRINRSY